MDFGDIPSYNPPSVLGRVALCSGSMNKNSSPSAKEINGLFENSDPDLVWGSASSVIRRISPGYDFALVSSIFADVLRIFRGEYPGYSAIKTLYHDLPHTMDVFLCSVRLMHGLHLSGPRLSNDELTKVMIATLMHDIGYAQQHGEDNGTGAQFTLTHVTRGIAFMKHYLAERNISAEFVAALELMMYSTDLGVNFSEIDYPDDRTRMLGKLVGTADLTGQMADRTYLEKLLFLYLEFKEANFGNYANTYDMLCQTRNFYEATREKLDCVFSRMYNNLNFHFKDTMGTERNYYLESIEKNIAYLSKVIALDEAEYLSMLKRGGIVEKSLAIAG